MKSPRATTTLGDLQRATPWLWLYCEKCRHSAPIACAVPVIRWGPNTWHRVVIFNENLCRIAEQYLEKESKVFIEGQLQTRKWQDQSGQDRYSTEVVLQGFRGELTLLDRAGGAGGGDLAPDDSGGDFGSTGPTRKVAAAGAGGRGSRADMDDEIPF